MADYRIFQAQILAKDPTTPRQYSVVEIPNGQKLVGVQLGNALKDQSAPLLGSIVLVLQLDAYRSYILMVLREPFNFLTTNTQYRGFIPATGNVSQDIAIGANPVQDGEIFMEATGPASPTGEGIPGFGAHLYLGNNGVAQIESGSMGEKLIIGGEGSSDDNEVILSADNGFIEGNPNDITQIQSTFNWDSLNNLQFGNVIANPVTSITIPLSELMMDAIGNITLRNTTIGTGVSLASLNMDPIGDISLTGTTISLNNGTEGVARLNDLTTSNLAIDPLYWKFVTAIQAFFTALSAFQGGNPVLQSQLGVLGSTFLAQVPIAPTSLTSKISTSSITVTAGN